MRLKEVLALDDNTTYKINYHVKNRQVCKIGTLKQFLRDVIEYDENDMAFVLRNVQFIKLVL